VDNKICYLNADLDLISAEELTVLSEAFTAKGVSALSVRQADDGFWWATFETNEHYPKPEEAIDRMLAVVESLSKTLRAMWDGCKLREVNIGYDCGAEPWAFNQGLSALLLGRMSAAGLSLRVTIYPDRNERRPE